MPLTPLPSTEQASTTPQLVASAAQCYGDRLFVHDGETRLSFRAFHACTRTLAAGLIANGFKPGDKAAIWSPNVWQWMVAALAIQYCGGVLVTINTRYKGAEAATILNASGATTLFCIGEFLGTNYPAMLSDQDLASLQHTVVFDDKHNPVDDGWCALLAQGEAYIAAHGIDAVDQVAAAVGAEDASDILFTSGTTGAPKGVVTGHRQNLQTFRIWADTLGLCESDRYLVINPFFHSFGYKAGILAGLLTGATLYPWQVFDTEQILAFIAAEKITMLPGPPTIFQSILAHPERSAFDTSSLVKAITGAASIPVKLIEDMQSVLGINTVLTAYGLSECCGVATMCRRGDSPDIIANTSGRAIAGIEVQCVDERGQEVARGEQGEIVVRGFNVMAGYLNNPDATHETIDADGWLHTGDVGTMDAQGNLAITDRLKDMFITGGFNCYPAEIENQLCAHPDISMAAVIGIPDERLGEVAMAWIVTRSGEPIDIPAITAWCRQQMANFKVPRRFQFVAQLPTNASGKVLKTELRTMYREL